MSKEAMQMALDALEEIHQGNMTPMAEEAWNKAIATIRQALEQPEQEPVAWMYDFLDPDNREEVIPDWMTQDLADIEREKGFNVRPLYTRPQPADEPVAWVCLGVENKHDIDFNEDDVNILPVGTMLYAHKEKNT